MRVYIIIIILGFSSCLSKKSNLEVCFQRVQNGINSDSVINAIKESPIDSYGNFSSLINKKVLEDSNSICSTSTKSFSLANSENSISINNLILFQHFQSFLRQERFNELKAKKNALEYEERMKLFTHPH